jgi:hypothetical protein
MSPKPPTNVREVDLAKPNAARMYDHYLGGSHNFESDRALAAQVAQVAPWVADVARINRAWLRRVVDFLMSQGIRQFLDLGSGIPTVGNVHELAQRRDPATRVVYVDYESVAVHHSFELLKDNENATVVWADVRNPRAVLAHEVCCARGCCCSSATSTTRRGSSRPTATRVRPGATSPSRR